MAISDEISYRTAFEAWKFQVDQYWTRSSYYVVFELAFAAGIWKVFDARHWWTSAFMSLGATVFTVLWILNNERLNEYISYYWKRLSQIEEALQIDGDVRIFSVLFAKIEKRRYPGDYRQYARALPPVFSQAGFGCSRGLCSVSKLIAVAETSPGRVGRKIAPSGCST